MLKNRTIRTATLWVVMLLAHCSFAQTLFRDDFDRDSLGSAWTHPEYSAWSIQNGRAYNNIARPGGTLQTTASFAQTDYAIETKAYSFPNGYFRQYGITFGKPDPQQDYGYIVKIWPMPGGLIALGRADGNEFFPTILDSHRGGNTLAGMGDALAYTFRIEHSADGMIKVFVNDGSGYGGEPLLQALDTTYQTLGHLGWRVDTEGLSEEFSVEYIEARKLDKPTPSSLLTNVQATGAIPYTVGKLNADSLLYVDRPYVFTDVPDFLLGAEYIRPANANKGRTDTTHLSFTLEQNANLYVFYDHRGRKLPGWLNGWQKLEDQVRTTDTGTHVLNVYTRIYGKGRVALGGNLEPPARGASTHYVVAAVPIAAGAVLEAEYRQQQGPIILTTHPGYSGTGYVDFQNPTNDSLYWEFNLPAAGAYLLGIKYALGSQRRLMELRVNDVTIDTALAFQNTGTWANWRILPVKTALKAGANRITLVATGNSGPNVDLLSLTPEPEAASAGRRTVPAETGEASAELIAYPNPTSGLTTIRYRLHEATPVSLALYDARGQKVSTLVDNEERPAGMYAQSFDASQVPSGLYFCRLRIGVTERVTKVIVIR